MIHFLPLTLVMSAAIGAQRITLEYDSWSVSLCASIAIYSDRDKS